MSRVAMERALTILLHARNSHGSQRSKTRALAHWYVNQLRRAA